METTDQMKQRHNSQTLWFIEAVIIGLLLGSILSLALLIKYWNG